MGKRIPIIELMTALAALQWILGPYIEYRNTYDHYRYHMWVPENEYMAFVVPAVLAFWLGANMIKPRIQLEDIKTQVLSILDEHPYFPYILIALGAFLPYLSGFFPPSLGFVFFLLSTLKYIGAIYLIHSEHRLRWWIFFGVLLFTMLTAIGAGMFHDVLLWGMLLFTFLAKEWNLGLSTKIIAAVLGLVFAMTIQTVKYPYREMTWNGGYEGNKTALFLKLAANAWSSGSIFTPGHGVHMNVRLNQGWIISAIMHNVPASVPYAKGATIRDGIMNSVVPRILNPNKLRAGGRENFRRFTGLSIRDDTSMGISIAGEGWANYGWSGGIIFMFLWGAFINWFWRMLERWSKYFPTLLIWSPMLFLQVVKAETEFGIVLNHLIKASIVVLGSVLLIRRIWGFRPESGQVQIEMESCSPEI